MAASSFPVMSHPVVATVALVVHRAVNGLGALPAAGARSLGVPRTSAAVGERVTLDVVGSTIVEAGAAVANDALLETDALGRYITRTTGVAVARALQAAAAAGDKIEALLIVN